MTWVNLHQHTTESHLDAICEIDDLFDRAKELGMPSLAITDHGTMGGIYKAYKASMRTGVKLIPGNEVYFVTNIAAKSKKDEGWKRYHLVLLAKNHEGYKNLLRLTYEGFKNAVYIPFLNKTFPRLDEALLRKFNKGLFALSACGGNIIAQSLLKDDEEQAVCYAETLKDIFGDRFYMELQPHDMQRHGYNQLMLNSKMKEVADKLSIPMVATCDAHYIRPEDEEIHDMLLAICDKKPLDDLDRHTYTTDILCEECKGVGFFDGDKKNKCEKCVRGVVSKLPCIEFYLKNENEVKDFFKEHFASDFVDTIVSNSGKIAEMCEPADYIKPSGEEHIPVFNMAHISQCPDVESFKSWREKAGLGNVKDDEAYMKYLCLKGFKKYCKDMSKEKKDEYWKRMVFEINVYVVKGFASYMLIVADYIRWARDNGILVGPGRGSVGGSLSAFFMDIHKIDSIKYGLLFERFQNLKKVDLPDVDSDFAPSGRDKIFDYVKGKYGEERVAFISNLNRFTPKVVVTDVVRSLRIGGEGSFRLSKIATAEVPAKAQLKDGRTIDVKTMAQAYKHAKGDNFRGLIDENPRLLKFANSIVGLPRNYSTHAAGVVISDIDLPDFVPVRKDKHGNYAVQYEKGVVEEIGLVKMDFLSLTTLDIMAETLAQAEKLGIDLMTLDELTEKTDDPNAYKIINSGYTKGCFQIEGSTLQPLCKPMKAKTIRDIAFINALGRPNCSSEEREEFIARRDGKKAVTSPHPLLDDILGGTYGISIFEEDLLLLAQKIAGWDLSEADGLRKITKLKEKGAALAEELEKKFVEDAVRHSSIPKNEAQHIWDKVVIPFSRYGFNAAHAIAYSIIGYATAYYKYYARGPFFAAVLNSKFRGSRGLDHDAKIVDIKKDMKQFGVVIDVCNINKSKQYYVATESKKMVTGLGAIKGIGDKALDMFIENQPYASFNDFVMKTMIDSRRHTRAQVQALAKAGAFDTLGVSRKYVHDHFDDLKKQLRKHIKKADILLFEGNDRDYPLPEVLDTFEYEAANDFNVEWSLQDRLRAEREVLGEFVSGSVRILHPEFFQGGSFDVSLEQLAAKEDGTKVRFEGVVTNLKILTIKKPGKSFGKSMARLLVENLRGETIEITMWPDLLEKYHNDLNETDIPFRGIFVISDWGGQRNLVATKSFELLVKNPK